MDKTRRKYAESFKAEAVELVINSGQPAAEIARELGVILSFSVEHGEEARRGHRQAVDDR